MTTPTVTTATPPPIDLDVDRLIGEIEAHLAAHTPTHQPAEPPAAPARTAHPLVTKTTAELVAEAIGHTPPPATTLDLAPPGTIARLLPHTLLRIPGVRRLNGGIRPITVEQHLTLTAHILQRGWTQHRYRTPSGHMCIQGAQRLLHTLGYGDHHTANQAAHRIQNTLTRRGITQPYPNWNDTPGRTLGEILNLIHTATTTA